jgi:hypothetical protein
LLSVLQATIKTVFSFEDTNFVLKYVDDENDLCTISNQPELDCAVSHSPLRLKVIKNSVSNVAVEPTLCSQRVQFLKEKLTSIETTLQKPDLPSHRVEHLTKRKANLQWKLEKLESPNALPVFPLAARPDETPVCDPKLAGGPGFRARFGCRRSWNREQTTAQQTFGDCPDAPGFPDQCEQKTGENRKAPCFRARFSCRKGVNKDLPVDAQTTTGHGQWATRGFSVKDQNEQKPAEDQTPVPGCFRGRGGRAWQANPQMQELHKEIFGLRDVVQAKRAALQNAKQNGAPQSEIEALFEEFVLAGNNLRAKKIAKQEAKDAMIKARVLNCNAERKCQDVAQSGEMPVCQKRQCQNPELAEMHNEIVGLRQILWTKKEALAQARRSGASQEELEVLFEAFVTARTNLREKKVAKRNCKDAAWSKPQTN